MGTRPDQLISPGHLLAYRPWRGRLHGPGRATLAIARVGLGLMLRRKLFWGLYAFSVMVFLFFFFGQYLLVWIEGQALGGESSIRLGSGMQAVTVDPARLMGSLRNSVKLNGTGETFRNFMLYESSIVMVILALAGSLLVGNDFLHGSLPFYLSKPLHRWHYVVGKCLAVGAFVNLMITLPAVALFVEYGLLTETDYFIDRAHLLAGILANGLLLTTVLSLLLVATASWVRRTVPLVMVWTTMFVFGKVLANLLVGQLHFDPRWRLLDLWNSFYLLASFLFSLPTTSLRPSAQPSYAEAALFLTAVSAVCLIYLNRRTRAVEVVP